MTHHRVRRSEPAERRRAAKSPTDDAARSSRADGLLIPSHVLALQRTAGNASVTRLVQTRSPRAVLQRHLVGDAFQAGARVIMAGETHGSLNKQEEADVWRTKNVAVKWEFDAFPIRGGTGPATRFDSPFMHFVVAAREVTDLLTHENLEEWLWDDNKTNQKLLLDEIELQRDVLADDVLGPLREEVQQSPEAKLKLERAELILAYLRTIAADMRKWYGLNAFGRQLDRDTARQIGTNVQLLATEIPGATALERPEFRQDPKLGRSASMVNRLSTFASTMAGMTIWKVGESHVNDAEQLMQGQSINGAVILHEAQYLPAFKEELAPIRQLQTNAFFQTTSVLPAWQHMVDKGWVG